MPISDGFEACKKILALINRDNRVCESLIHDENLENSEN